MRFTIRDLFALTLIAAIVFGYGIPATAADNFEELLLLSTLFVLAACGYSAARFVVARWIRK
jgi:hypothetical protein